MPQRSERGKRLQVRAENPSGVCGYVDHMTIDELKARAVGEEFDATCPACGMFHLTKEEINILNKEKITRSKDYADMKKEAEEDSL
ncbi:hypothetical protein [Desulfosediminicola flagellatus]|uniref:hypothetical protein n=1 Tax=Desulfosediminicola flagellatus TaxID=2569541 RepID=UPI0010ACA6FC|nr:hypothetical protein [Desulfosediminicola flagellatus]